MGGGLMQLVAYGAQDIYLTGNPQITFFKVVYRRHTNFSMESIQQTINGTPSFGGNSSVTISRNGDLVSKIYVQFDPQTVLAGDGNNNLNHVPNAGHALLKETELEIGGQKIDRQYSHWLNVWGTLTGQLGYCKTDTAGKFRVSPLCEGDGAELTATPTMYQKMAFCCKDGAAASSSTSHVGERFATVPLQFWFCRNPGLALPLIALQYHEVKLKLTFPTLAELFAGGTHDTDNATLTSVEVWADYIYLDTDERRRFAQVSHEYLIEQLQYQSESKGSTFTLNFNHPVKELVWAGARSTTASVHGGPSTPTGLVLANGTKLRDNDTTTGGTVTLKLNGHERFAPRHDNYFTRTQVWQHHNALGDTDQGDAVHVYSFALKPEEHQPSGTCNFSRIDNAQLIYTKTVGGSTSGGTHDGGLHIYAVNYNVLRIMSGMGGLAYSN
jgi:hypothetical protein